MKKIFITISLLLCFSHNLFSYNFLTTSPEKKPNIPSSIKLVKINVNINNNSSFDKLAHSFEDYFKDRSTYEFNLKEGSNIGDFKTAICDYFKDKVDLDKDLINIAKMPSLKALENKIFVNTKGEVTYWIYITQQYHLRKLLDRNFSSLEKYLRDTIAQEYYDNNLEIAKFIWDTMNLNERLEVLYTIDFENRYNDIPNLLSNEAYKHYKLQDNGINEYHWMNSNEEARKEILKEIF